MTDHDLERQTAATASRKPVRSRSPLAALESRAVRAVLYAVIVGVLVAAYWFQVLPHRADVLLDYFLLMSVATTISPLPVAPSIIYAATQAPDGATGIWLVALVGAVGTTIAYLLEYAILSRVFSLRGTRRIKRSRVYLWLVDLFQRAPFVALTVAAFLPLPVDGVRLLAISIHYHRRRFALAAFVGRMPRYLLIAVLGRSVDWQTLLASARRLLAGEAVGGGAGDAVWLVALAGLVALVGLGIAIRFGLRGWLRRRRGGDRVAAVLFLGLVGSTLLATPLAAADAEKPDTVAVATGAADSSAPADPELAAVLGHFDAAIADIQDVRATFTQRNWSPVFEDWEYSAGRLWYRVPGELVMRYEEPLHQEVFIDTSGVWVYLVDQRQAQRYPFTTPAERDGSLAILWRPSHELAERYTITLAAAPPRGEAGGSWLALVPRDAEVAQVVSGLFLRLDPARGLSDCILLERANGERVRLEIDTFEANPGLDDDVFRFVPPEGVDVVRF